MCLHECMHKNTWARVHFHVPTQALQAINTQTDQSDRLFQATCGRRWPLGHPITMNQAIQVKLKLPIQFFTSNSRVLHVKPTHHTPTASEGGLHRNTEICKHVKPTHHTPTASEGGLHRNTEICKHVKPTHHTPTASEGGLHRNTEICKHVKPTHHTPTASEGGLHRNTEICKHVKPTHHTPTASESGLHRNTEICKHVKPTHHSVWKWSTKEERDLQAC